MRGDVAKIDVSSGTRWWGASTAYGYQTTLWLGRLRLHVFWREDPGEAFHDHPWEYWTWPLHDYVEQVLVPGTGGTYRRLVPARRWSHREADHAHRILGRWDGNYDDTDEPTVMSGAVVTVVRRGPHVRDWFYLIVGRGFKVHRFPWRAYLQRMDSKPRRVEGG